MHQTTRPTDRTAAPARAATLVVWVWLLQLPIVSTLHAAQFVINGPAGSGEFGRTVTALPNGNIVVTDPGFDAPGPIADVGAVYLYRPNGILISTVRGSSANDRVGSGGVVVLVNGNFVVRSPSWRNGAAANAGAVTLGSATSGISGVVSPANSLVGSTAADVIGAFGVTALANGNYVVENPYWDNGLIVDAGAVTFGSGVSGISGMVSPANSLVGSTEADRVGEAGVTVLANDNYVVRSPIWDNGAIVDAGAVTLGSGVSGISGVVSPDNSLVGSTTQDRVGSSGVTALANGNYVVRIVDWDNGAVVNAGAVTFGSGISGVSGAVSPANSLVGSTADDRVGGSGVIALANGSYVVRSPNWNNGPIVDAGAVTFGSGASGISGAVSPANSLVGSTADDRIGSSGVTALENSNYLVQSGNWDNGAVFDAGAVTFGPGVSGISGVVSPANSLVGSTNFNQVGGSGVIALASGNYVVRSPFWHNGGIFAVGAVTFGSGTSGISGVVSPANSLVGSTTQDRVGSSGVAALANGNYVVASTLWDNGSVIDAGAVTFGSGVSGISGVVSPANSLVGSRASDSVGNSGVTALANGNYVVANPLWDNGTIMNVGAVSFGSGSTGVSGVVSPANSLVGSKASDWVGSFGVTALASGDYVVVSPNWDDSNVIDAGALTFGSGMSGISGVVSQANSLVGSTSFDRVGDPGVIALANGNYVARSDFWNNGPIVDAGAITLGLFNVDLSGPITSTHSVLGTVEGQGGSQVFDYDGFRNQLAVGQPLSNRVVLHRTGFATAISIVGDTPDPSLIGQPVTFTATVSAVPSAPTVGQVMFSASSGESCVDTTPMPTSATTADYACAITFTASGTSTVIAEYTGSTIHAYSGSAAETHTTIVDPVFADGFEVP